MGQTTNEQPSEPPHRNILLPMDRAEYLVDLLGARLGRWTNNLGHEVQRLWARAREEGEDIWAEANDLRSHTQTAADLTGQTGKEISRSATVSTAPAESAAPVGPTTRTTVKKPTAARKSSVNRQSSADAERAE